MIENIISYIRNKSNKAEAPVRRDIGAEARGLLTYMKPLPSGRHLSLGHIEYFLLERRRFEEHKRNLLPTMEAYKLCELVLNELNLKLTGEEKYD
jgi:hypothetical protein